MELESGIPVTLDQVAGVSPLNPRHGADPVTLDLEGLKASLLRSGQLEAMIFEESSDGLLVLAGSRRLYAWRELVAEGKAPTNQPLDAIIAKGTYGEKKRLALEAQVAHRPLHPVSEYEAFAALEGEFTVDEIARDFGRTIAQVRQRLALGALAPEIRDAWRAGKITAEMAQAFTCAATIEAQRAVFDVFAQEDFDCDARDVRDALRADTMGAKSPEAIFVGAEAYLAAGGRIQEDLFTEEAMWRDGAILRQLSEMKLLEEADAIARAEGWGFVAEPEADVEAFRIHDKVAHPDFLPSEKERLDQLDCADELEARCIVELAVLRSLTTIERWHLGIHVSLDDDGRLDVTRGILSENTPADHPGVAASDGAAQREAADSSPAASREDKPERNAKELTHILLNAVEAAFQDSIRTRPDLALMVAIAGVSTLVGIDALIETERSLTKDEIERLRAQWHKIHSGMSSGSSIVAPPGIKFSNGVPNDRPLAAIADWPLCDLVTGFSKIVANNLVVDRKAPLSDYEPLAIAMRRRGAALQSGFAKALDYEAYFAAATKQAAVKAIETCDSVAAAAEASKLKKDTLALRAATLARDKQWLPSPLDQWAALPEGDEAHPVDAFLSLSAAREGLDEAHAETAA